MAVIRTCLATLIWLAALLLPAPGHAGALYGVTRLPDNFHPADINNAGQMAGALYAGDGVHAAIQADGSMVDLGTFGMAYSYANAINDAGAVAGNVGTAAGPEHAFLYRDGAVRDIGTGVALGINDRGDVVGQLYQASGAVGFLYSGSALTELGHLGHGNISRATAINNAGQIVGESNLAFDAQAPTHPYLLDGGTLADLGTLANRGVNSAMAINNAGQIAGYSDAGNSRMHVVLYERGGMTDLGSFGGLDVTIGGINGAGQIVGTGNTRDGPDVAFISRAGTLVDLNTLIDPASGWDITSALDINDRGQIIGYGCREGQCNAVRLELADAVPEPAAVALLLPGWLLLLGMRHRRKKTAGPCGYGGSLNDNAGITRRGRRACARFLSGSACAGESISA
jgi:probable HAF family extracellular repeat protein